MTRFIHLALYSLHACLIDLYSFYFQAPGTSLILRQVADNPKASSTASTDSIVSTAMIAPLVSTKMIVFPCTKR